jgi:hypothetical protein
VTQTCVRRIRSEAKSTLGLLVGDYRKEGGFESVYGVLAVPSDDAEWDDSKVKYRTFTKALNRPEVYKQSSVSLHASFALLIREYGINHTETGRSSESASGNDQERAINFRKAHAYVALFIIHCFRLSGRLAEVNGNFFKGLKNLKKALIVVHMFIIRNLTPDSIQIIREKSRRNGFYDLTSQMHMDTIDRFLSRSISSLIARQQILGR